MADEAPKFFSLTEAESLRTQLEPLLLEAIEARRKIDKVDEQLEGLAERIQQSGGMLVPYEHATKWRREHDHLATAIENAVERIHATGCVVKDIEIGLLDFPSRIDGQEVFLCWRLGEDRIRFYHRMDEGFAGRKPIDPRDAGHESPIQ
ncbi:MAG: DUF2203 domain-containing protein [Acidobacteriota bacterium]|nr:DUF2203 domain-containing protein [Acidobacteriota bacterium]